MIVRYEFGVSSKASDGDNLIKSLQDALCEKYGFNDLDIYRWEVEKKIVPTGQEYAAFEIEANLINGSLCSSTNLLNLVQTEVSSPSSATAKQVNEAKLVQRWEVASIQYMDDCDSKKFAAIYDDMRNSIIEIGLSL